MKVSTCTSLIFIFIVLLSFATRTLSLSLEGNIVTALWDPELNQSAVLAVINVTTGTLSEQISWKLNPAIPTSWDATSVYDANTTSYCYNFKEPNIYCLNLIDNTVKTFIVNVDVANNQTLEAITSYNGKIYGMLNTLYNYNSILVFFSIDINSSEYTQLAKITYAGWGILPKTLAFSQHSNGKSFFYFTSRTRGNFILARLNLENGTVKTQTCYISEPNYLINNDNNIYGISNLAFNIYDVKTKNCLKENIWGSPSFNNTYYTPVVDFAKTTLYTFVEGTSRGLYCYNWTSNKTIIINSPDFPVIVASSFYQVIS